MQLSDARQRAKLIASAPGPFDHDVIELWLWDHTDEFGKRRRSRWLMSEKHAARYRDAVKVKGSLERRRPIGSMSDWRRG